MARKPTKNRINMHDIVAQPLGMLPDAVDAILKRPEELDDIEISSIFHETSYILLRAEEALSVKDGNAFCALFKLFSEGFAHSETSFEEGIKTVVLHAPLLQTIHNIFRTVVEREALPLHSPGTVELIQVISNLCDGEALKENCGALFMSGLANLLVRVYADEEEAKKHFHVQRGAATALINLVKGSKQNKTRLPSWKFVADCCAASVDVFFQLQCVELLFRVSRQKKSILAQLGDALPSAVTDKLGTFPNDGTLLGRMTNLIDTMNASRAEVLRFKLMQVSAAETVLTESTDVYFTPSFFIIMVTAANADNITIPYRLIRSVTLGKDGRIIIKLEEFPVKLEVLLSHTAGMDTITLKMTTELLNKFKQSPIRPWIVSALADRQPAGPSSGVKRAAEDPQRVAEVTTSTSALSVADEVQPLSIGADALRKKSRVEENVPPRAAAAAAATAGHSRGDAAASTLIQLVDSVVSQSPSHNKASAVLSQLQRIINAKVEIRRGESVAALNAIMTSIQESVDAARQATDDSRKAWRHVVAAEIDRLEGSISATQDLAAAGVERLNEDLRQVKQSNQAINERIACIEVELQRALEESRERESVDMKELRASFEGEIERQEFVLDQCLLNSRVNPAVLLSEHLHPNGNPYGFP